MTEKFSEREKALAFASAMSGAVLTAIVEQRADNPTWLLEFQRALAAGEARLAIFIRCDKETVYLSAGALPASELKDPIEGHHVLGPLVGPPVSTLEEFEAMMIIDPASRH
jgi:hypothetical protein